MSKTLDKLVTEVLRKKLLKEDGVFDTLPKDIQDEVSYLLDNTTNIENIITSIHRDQPKYKEMYELLTFSDSLKTVYNYMKTVKR